jgi:hypothetical protein
LENLEEMEKFLDTCDLQKLNQEGINNLSRSIAGNVIKAVIKNFSKKISPGLDSLLLNFT